ncbi:MAG: Asp-tRNA(Asn)/Glu-tRNA(Gln) amidotransferase subunit GatA [Chloroflexi bacterium]|nr:Asp-tRNA(Asn)/Glu-tRNA(Gln) amidotransferase subunit GatA [Chloroflexota bacterium]
MKADELQALTLAEAARLIAGRELSPRELTEECLERIEAVEPKLNAFITVTADEALEAARRAEGAIAAGEYRGPLHGIPVGLKDLFATRGVRTTAGSKIMADHVPDEDATVVRRLKEAGAVIVGKLNLHEFAFGATSVNPHYGPVRNPWDTGRIAGGSSGGSAAAVAAGECLAALGTDTGGSIRIPSSLCGIVGLKPTYGRVSRYGVVPLSWALDHVGPMCRTVEDAALVLGAIAGADPLDPSAADVVVPRFESRLDGDVKGLRLGVPREYFFDNVDAEVEAAVRGAVAVLEELGASVREVSLPHLEATPHAVNAIMLPEALAYHQAWLKERPGDYGEDVRLRLELGATYPAVHYVQAQRTRSLIVEEWGRVFEEIDLLVTPATPIPAAAIGEAELTTTLALIRFTNPFNLSGQPAVSLPCGLTKTGLPIGLQLVGRWWDEATVLRAAHAYERANQWHKVRPKV